jgi:uncharacterized protein
MSITIEKVTIPSARNSLLGRVYRQNDTSKRPAVVICHGYPGDTKNMDLAEELALNGYVTLIFFYQGAWGSSGKYSLTKLETGARDALAYLRTLTYVDTERVGLISHSMGALPLTKTMSLDSTIKTGILIAPASDTAVMAAIGDENLRRMVAMAEGKLNGVSVDSIAKDLTEVAKTTNPVRLVSKIRAPLMVVAASKDTVTPPEACKMLFDSANEPKKWVLIEGADHGFSEHRILLINAIIERLRVSL